MLIEVLIACNLLLTFPDFSLWFSDLKSAVQNTCRAHHLCFEKIEFTMLLSERDNRFKILKTVSDKDLVTRNSMGFLERVVCNQFINYLTAKERLTTKQNGSRKWHSTETSLLHMTDAVLKEISITRTLINACMLLDMSKAFDSVDH